MRSILELILNRFWLHFGSILGVQMEPSWHQIGSKIDLQIDQKMITFWIALGSDFGRFWPPTWPPYGGSQRLGFGALWDLGAILGSRCSQELSKTLPRPILLKFGLQVGGFRVPLWWILAPILVDFWCSNSENIYQLASINP